MVRTRKRGGEGFLDKTLEAADISPGTVRQRLRTNDAGTDTVWANELTDDEQDWYQIRLAKLRPSLLYLATSSFTPTGYDVYPVFGRSFNTGSSERLTYRILPLTMVIKDGTVITLSSDAWFWYLKSTEVHNDSDTIQGNPKTEYFKRLRYLESVDYSFLSTWISASTWDTLTLTPGAYGSIILGWSYGNIRTFTFWDTTLTYSIYKGAQHRNYEGINPGHNDHMSGVNIPVSSVLKIDIQAGNSSGASVLIRYLDLPSWW